VRRRPKCASHLLLLSLVLGITSRLPAQNAPTRSDAEMLLRKWQQTNLIEDKAFEPFQPLGAKALPLFAPFLTHKELGMFAELAMQRIDSVAATPYLLKVLPLKDGNTQSSVIRAANRALIEYGWHERAGKPQLKPGEKPPRFPRNTQPYPYTKEMYEAARAMLEDKVETGIENKALLTIGLTGSRRDFAMLRKYAALEPSNTYEMACRDAALSALARLGDKTALNFIAAELEKPVKTKPAEPYSKGSGRPIQPPPGAIVVTPEEAQRLRGVIEMAAFSMNPRFVPLLARHLDDPRGQSYGDYSDPAPSDGVCAALGQIVEGTESVRSLGYWKDWWSKQKPK
jgi:hypothetical protein